MNALFRRLPLLAGTLTAGVGLLLIAWWLGRDPTAGFVEHGPNMDDPFNLRKKSVAKPRKASVYMGRNFRRGDGVPASLPGSWPRFRGPRYDNVNTETVPLAETWPASGPERLWSVDLGEGYAGAAVDRGRCFILDYDEERKADALRCLSLADGKEIWRRWYEVKIKKNHGMSRTVPTVTDKHVVSIGPRCHVLCLAVDDGAFKWGMDLQSDYGTKEPGWYTGQCPYVEDHVAVLAPAGTNVLMMGVDCETGKVLWDSPNPRKWRMSHASIMPMALAGRRMYVYAASGGIAGVSADAADRGKVLWETTAWNYSTVAPSPVILDDGRIFVTAGYGAGSMMLKVTAEDGRFTVAPLFKLAPREGLCCEQQTPILYKDHLFAVMPKDAATAVREQFACVHRDDCAKILWASGKEQRFGLGPFLLADGKFLAVNDDGVLTLMRASVKEFTILAQAKVLDGHDSWAPLALAGGRLLVRDSKRMVCLDLRARRS